jgi:arylsulfatase A-like enzyme
MPAPRAPLVVAWFAAAAVGMAALAALDLGPSSRSTVRPHVVLVSIDTLRADHLGCYGYDQPTSPRIDAFSREAVLFEEVVAAAPSTLASHASLLTSLVVPHHGASFARRAPLPADRLTLADVLHERGYATVAWHGGGQIHERFGLDQGFERYDRVRGRFGNAVGRALEWLDQRSPEDDAPFFMFLHTYEVHLPYTPRARHRALFGRYPTRLEDHIAMEDLRPFNRGERDLTRGDRDHIVAAYDAEVRSADEAFGTLLEGLRDRGLLDRTVMALTSDHGEELGERTRIGWHSHTLYDELLRVPLIVRFPGGLHAGTRVRGQVGGIDVAPTLLDIAGFRSPAVFQGRSLLERVEGLPSDRDSYVLSARDVKRGKRLSLRSDRWKWIVHRGLFDLEGDPGETKNLRDRDAQSQARARMMKARADRWAMARPEPTTRTVGLSEDLTDQLRALGYVP